MSGPQTKGLLLVSIIADLARFVEEGRLSREDLEADLTADALKLFDDGVSPISWYEGDIYPQLAQILIKVDGLGPGDMKYLRQRGEGAGRRLMESGLYQQLDFMQRRVSEAAAGPVDRKLFEQGLRMITSMTAALMNGGIWEIEQDPEYDDRVQVVVSDIAGMSEESAQATCGILSGIAMYGGAGFSYRYERLAPDRLVYRMDRDISELSYGGVED